MLVFCLCFVCVLPSFPSGVCMVFVGVVLVFLLPSFPNGVCLFLIVFCLCFAFVSLCRVFCVACVFLVFRLCLFCQRFACVLLGFRLHFLVACACLLLVFC